jgi:5'-AMP-activated protein kinase regulatory beta subunit
MKTNGKHMTKVSRQTALPVRIEFDAPAAADVAIAGSFNNWRPDVTKMIPVGCGRWFKTLVLPPGTYEYLFVADGKWLRDPAAKGAVPNPFGGVNSVLTVAN